MTQLSVAVDALEAALNREDALRQQLHASLDVGINALRTRAERSERALREVRDECEARLRTDGPDPFLLRLLILTGALK